MSPKCYACSGSGKKTCQICKGTGETVRGGSGDTKKGKKKMPCSSCGGRGEINCTVCGGAGRR